MEIERISPPAKLPRRAYPNDAGLDLYVADFYSILPGQIALIKTGLKIAIPSGYAGLIWDKSSLAKTGLHALAGVIDAGYRGEVIVSLINLSQDIVHLAAGQKIAQLLIQKIENLPIKETKISDRTDRAASGFGSSGFF